MSKKVVVLLAEGFEEMEAATPIDVLRRAGAEVTVAGLGGRTIRGAHGLAYQADAELDAVDDDWDLVVLPGGMPGAKNLGESPKARKLAEKALASGKRVAAICAAPVMTLGAWGMLDGRKATCYPGMEKMFPAKVAFSPERVVVDGQVTTSRGPGTALEFSLALAEQLAGRETSAGLAKEMLAHGAQ